MVIVVMGPAGSGKTLVGSVLSAALGWLFVDGDDCHPPRNVQLMREGIPLTDHDRAPWLRELHDIISRVVHRREHAVIACSALKARYRDQLRGDLRPVRFVYLQASPALLASRLEARAGHFAGPPLLESQLADLEAPADAAALIVDAAKEPAILVAAIRRELGL